MTGFGRNVSIYGQLWVLVFIVRLGMNVSDHGHFRVGYLRQQPAALS
jgi:hypothetical protein